jgi:hypothetical protein
MVKRSPLILIALLIFALAVSAASSVNAQNLVYSVNHEWVQIFINQDGTIDLTYNMTLTVTQGTLHSFDVGQPNRDFNIGQAVDQYGNQIHTYSYTPDVASVDFKQPLNVGDSIWYTITTNVAGMISNDSQNPGNFGMQFIPQWDTAVPISDVRIQIVLPPDVTVPDVKTTQNFYNGTSIVNGQLAVYWEKSVIQANEQFKVGVSFPARFIPNYNPSQGGSGGGGIDLGVFGALIGVVGLIGAIVVIALVFKALSKSSYISPKVGMETLGIKRGLTAVEASYLIDIKPPQIVTEILYSLLQKRAVWAQETKPSLKLKVLPPFDNKTGPKDNPLRYYEIDFLNALRPDGTLDEEKLAKTIMFLRDTVEQKLQGYSRKDTMDYYRKIAAQAWTQVEQAGTVDLAANAYDEQLLWLMLDPNQRTRTETVFRDRVIAPNPLWFWWWYGYTTYHPHPTYSPNVNVPSQSGPPPQIPGADFANNIATAVEGTSNSIVVNLEKFANAIVPPPPKVSHEPAHKEADCVCACHACACACACVSCACACAGGGGR